MDREPPFAPVKVKGKYLHSPYDPVREAEKVVGETDYSQKSLLILFEPGLGYACPILLNKYPSLRLLIISPLDLVEGDLRMNNRVCVWTGDLGEGLGRFLSEQIHESDLSRLAYLPWPPSVRILPDEASRAGETLGNFLTRLRANHSHVSGFGTKNLRNSLINYLLCDPPRLPDLRRKPVLIAASGPSLSDHLDEIRSRGRGYFLIALPSAAAALTRQGIMPDLIISTDPGYWATCHFAHVPEGIPLGIGLSGRAPFRRGGVFFPLFNQQSYTDNQLLSRIPLPVIPGTGSVALSALEWAEACGASSVTFAGLDMCLEDLKSHVSPHSFETLLLSDSQRLNSLHHIYFTRAAAVTVRREGSLRYGHSLEQYRTWLEKRGSAIPLYRLGPNRITIKGLKELNRLGNYPNDSPTWFEPGFPPREERKELVLSLLRSWRDAAPERLKVLKATRENYPRDFDDFLYTLIPEEFTRIRNGEVNGESAARQITELLHRMEVICEGIS